MSVHPILFELRNVSKAYAINAESDYSVLKNIMLTLHAGQTVAITGPSGSGKSTLLNILGTLDKPTEGDVFFRDQDITEFSSNDLARIRNQDVGFIFQLHHLLPQCTVLENVLIPVLAFGNSDDIDKATHRAEVLLTRVGLGQHMNSMPGTLSGGESQRVAVVRALINNPSILLADEPTGSLDQENAKSLIELLIDLNNEENTALVVVTHSNELAKMMSTVYHLQNGQLEKQQ